MLRKNIYGVVTDEPFPTENEKDLLYIKECAESVGIEVIEGETAFSISFMAKVMRALRESEVKPNE